MNDEDINGIILPEGYDQPQPVIENQARNDPYYMRRTQDYLAAKYISADNFNKYHAVWSIKKAQMLGIGFEVENQKIMTKGELLVQLQMDISRIQWKPKRSMGSPRRIERPGIGEQYQENLRSEY